MILMMVVMVINYTSIYINELTNEYYLFYLYTISTYLIRMKYVYNKI